MVIVCYLIKCKQLVLSLENYQERLYHVSVYFNI